VYLSERSSEAKLNEPDDRIRRCCPPRMIRCSPAAVDDIIVVNDVNIDDAKKIDSSYDGL